MPYHSNLRCIHQKNLLSNPKPKDHGKHYVSLRNFRRNPLQNMHLYLLALAVKKLPEHDHKNRYKLGSAYGNARPVSCLLLLKQPPQLPFRRFHTYHRTRQRCGSSGSNNPTVRPTIRPLCSLNILLLSFVKTV